MKIPAPHRPAFGLTFAITFALAAPDAPAAEVVPLHQRIDALIAAGDPDFEKTAAPLADDAEFLRRAYLDLTGCIPPATEARAFLADRSPDKRRRLIDRLLGSPEYARHLSQVLDVMLMERRRDNRVPTDAWREYLRQSVADNKPWDVLVREILSADGADKQTRPAAKFLLDRDADPLELTRDVSRLFLGRDITCAQCHDHPSVEDYKQQHFYGLQAFFNRTYLFPNEKDKNATLAEKAEGEVNFVSVFDPKKAEKHTGPRLPGLPAVAEPSFEKGQEYAVAPDKKNKVRPVPKFSRRAQLGPWITNPANAAFARTGANRFWAMLTGRGLVHPLDKDHSGNPPSHPELLDLLAEQFVARDFDVRWLLREIALSKTYQRSSALPEGATEPPPQRFAVAALKPLSAEQLAWSVMQATGLTDAQRAALGNKLSEPALFKALERNVTPFVRTFGGPSGQPADDFEATLEQTLFIKNGAQIRGWLQPRSGNLTDRLRKLSDPGALAEELYLSVLTRLPT
ncbi:MAG TPA: DUF1549 domain-containing protein, partial [Gemmataceae bacterium]